jgi:hypothetical protein
MFSVAAECATASSGLPKVLALPFLFIFAIRPSLSECLEDDLVETLRAAGDFFRDFDVDIVGNVL